MFRSDGESRVNRQPLLFCIQSQEEEIQPEGMDVADRTTECKSAPKDHEAKAEANVTSTSGGDDALICSLESNEESWVLDSGASFHATSQKQFFERYVPGNLGKDVRHIPDLRKNLISVGQLASEGYTTIFHGDDWKISKGAMMVARGKKSGTLYMTAGARCSIAIAAGNEYPNMWHQRLGHMSEKGMKIMHSKGKLPGLESVEIDMCEDCIYGKQKRVSFQTSGRTPKKERLELVHSDVWGPTTISSIVGNTTSRWKAMVENETGLKIKRLRTDNGGSDMDDIRRLKQQLSKEFDMKDLGPAKKILGMQITRDKHRGILQLSEAEYINRVLQRFNMGDTKPVSTPVASHFHLSNDQSPQTKEERDLMAKLQKIVTLSTTEAEYVAVTEASKEMIWLQGLLTELGFKQEKNVLHSDSQSAIHLAKNSAFHSRTKHIGLRYHFIISLLEDEVLILEKIQGSKNPADMLTKTVAIDKRKLCSTSVGLQE
ncbi:Toll-Interleukin-Resistance domain family protein [Prunus dulcis]|uniref:Toll-Interleukin-Resistance domain family protein n=1 Tax=Prunus dulcis TaxID=3755 RepID=A0A4Y1RV75_PRUDU|nr:Toll-Interleukin-Resistance domain family protein [Prunus dulcis]